MQRRDFLRHTTLAVATLAVQRSAQAAEARTIYLNPVSGRDANPGTKSAPLRTLAAAAARVNAMTEPGATTVILDEGIYAVGETALFKPNRPYSKAARLTIRAAVLPDDPDWHQGRMPTLIHTMPLSAEWNRHPDPFGGVAYGMQIETSHVTVQGLRVLGMPIIERPKAGAIHRLYTIGRDNVSLDDLEIRQCLFAGDEVTNPAHLPLLIRGNGLVVDHCVFHGVKQSVVYWTPGSTGHALRHCVIYGCKERVDVGHRDRLRLPEQRRLELWLRVDWSGGAVGPGRARADCGRRPTGRTWSGRSSAGGPPGGGPPGGGPGRPPEGPVAPESRYKVKNSLFAANKKLTGSGAGPALNFRDSDGRLLTPVDTTTTDQPVPLELDQEKRNYLHPVAGSETAQVGAGLFTKPPA